MTTQKLDPMELLKNDGLLRLTLVARLRPASGLDRFQPAGFPEIGHVIYDAPRRDEEGRPTYEPVCIVDSAASMANHLETVCLRAPHNPDLQDELAGLPHVRLMTERGWPNHERCAPTAADQKRLKDLEKQLKKHKETANSKIADLEKKIASEKRELEELQKLKDLEEQLEKEKETANRKIADLEKKIASEKRELEELHKRSRNIDTGKLEVVVTTLTEGHRLASDYFLDGSRLVTDNGKTSISSKKFEEELREECKIKPLGKNTRPGFDAWWDVFSRIFRYDPNSLVHGVLFQRWNVKIPRVLTAHIEARGARRVDRAGIKFDPYQKTKSGQPIFAVDDEVASEIRATFVIDLALVRSFGHDRNGLREEQKALLVALALWKIGRLLRGPWRYRSGCDLECESLRRGTASDAPKVDPNDLAGLEMRRFIEAAKFEQPAVTEIYRSADELYREGEAAAPAGAGEGEADGDEGEGGTEDDES